MCSARSIYWKTTTENAVRSGGSHIRIEKLHIPYSIRYMQLFRFSQPSVDDDNAINPQLAIVF